LWAQRLRERFSRFPSTCACRNHADRYGFCLAPADGMVNRQKDSRDSDEALRNGPEQCSYPRGAADMGRRREITLSWNKVVRNPASRSLTLSPNLTPQYQASGIAGQRKSPPLTPWKGFLPGVRQRSHCPSFGGFGFEGLTMPSMRCPNRSGF